MCAAGGGHGHPPDTTVTPEALRWWTLTRTLLGDSMPEGPYRIVPELILLAPVERGTPPCSCHHRRRACQPQAGTVAQGQAIHTGAEALDLMLE
jgi:hypothetical protein